MLLGVFFYKRRVLAPKPFYLILAFSDSHSPPCGIVTFILPLQVSLLLSHCHSTPRDVMCPLCHHCVAHCVVMCPPCSTCVAQSLSLSHYHSHALILALTHSSTHSRFYVWFWSWWWCESPLLCFNSDQF